jgi:hypothetical protein
MNMNRRLTRCLDSENILISGTAVHDGANAKTRSCTSLRKIDVTPQCCILKKNPHPQAFGFCWISLFQFFFLISENSCNTSVLHHDEESPPAGLRILLNILILGFSLIPGNVVFRGANAYTRSCMSLRKIDVTHQCCIFKKNHHPQAFRFCWLSLFQEMLFLEELTPKPRVVCPWER